MTCEGKKGVSEETSIKRENDGQGGEDSYEEVCIGEKIIFSLFLSLSCNFVKIAMLYNT
jgi:hypothetical protein